MSWSLEKLGNVCEVIAGQSPPSSTYNNKGVGLPFFQGKTDFGDHFPSIRLWCKTPNKIAEPNDILLSVRAPVGPTNICALQSCIGRGLAAIRSNGKTYFKYVYYYFKFIENKLSNAGNGSTFSAITIGDVKNINIPLPSYSTQEKIAAILDKADSLRRKDQYLLASYEALLQSIFYQMFGDPVKNEKGWDVRPVIENCECIVPGRDKPKSFSGKIPWITTDDLNHLGYTSISKKSIGLTKAEIENVRARIIPAESVLMTCVGDLGIISIARSEMVVNQQLHSFQIKKNLNNVFLMFALSYQKPYMLNMASLTTVPYMNKTICNSVPIIVPPINLQNEFFKLYQNINFQKLVVEKQSIKSKQLFQSLLQKAFREELIN
jgi:type I restriction enzyme, S subunit